MDENNKFRRALKSPVMVGGLCLLAGLAVYSNLTNSGDQPSASTPLPNPPLDSLTSLETSTPPQGTPHEDTAMIWIEHPNRDPFAPHNMIIPATSSNPKSGRPTPSPSEPLSLPSQLALRAVALEYEEKSAVINRTIVHEGERVEGFLVLSIEAKGVWLERHGRKQFLTFTEKKISS